MKKFNGMWRGTCVQNVDPLVKGRIKVYVPGVYSKDMSMNPSLLPWAEPAMNIFGGSWNNEKKETYGDLNIETGATSNPHTSTDSLKGAEIWLFFERGDHNFPIYFAACQSGDGWLSEHENQHVMHTDNVRIRIDEKLEDEKSTTQFDTYNAQCNEVSKTMVRKKVPTRVDIEIWNRFDSAVHLHMKGDVNMHIEGDYYEEIFGDRHITHYGNTFTYHKGDTLDVIEGNTHQIIDGNYSLEHIGNSDITREGNENYILTEDQSHILFGKKDLTVFKQSTENYQDEITDSLVINTQKYKLTSYSSTDIQTNTTFKSVTKGNMSIEVGIDPILDTILGRSHLNSDLSILTTKDTGFNVYKNTTFTSGMTFNSISGSNTSIKNTGGTMFIGSATTLTTKSVSDTFIKSDSKIYIA